MVRTREHIHQRFASLLLQVLDRADAKSLSLLNRDGPWSGISIAQALAGALLRMPEQRQIGAVLASLPCVALHDKWSQWHALMMEDASRAGKHTIFGRVTRGMDTVRRMGNLQTDRNDRSAGIRPTCRLRVVAAAWMPVFAPPIWSSMSYGICAFKPCDGFVRRGLTWSEVQFVTKFYSQPELGNLAADALPTWFCGFRLQACAGGADHQN